MLFYAFLFAALMFSVAAYVIHGMYVRMGSLDKSLHAAKLLLKESIAKGERLQTSLDKLILRRTELRNCLNAAMTDEERVTCIKKLMEE
jgi:hypothetical protein